MIEAPCTRWFNLNSGRMDERKISTVSFKWMEYGASNVIINLQQFPEENTHVILFVILEKNINFINYNVFG